MFTFPKHVSHLGWQLHVTCCVSIVGAIQCFFVLFVFWPVSTVSFHCACLSVLTYLGILWLNLQEPH